jgi:membrane associated rhomboid family serine protease
MILVWIAAYVWQATLDEDSLIALHQTLGVRPAAVIQGWGNLIDGTSWGERMGGVRDCILPLFTYQFLHGGPLHLVGNSLFFWVFGGRLEARAGARRMLIFTLLCGAAGALLQVQGASSWTPTIGASGAVAGTLAAYLLFYRRSRILIVVPVVVVPVFAEIPVTVLALAFCLMQIPEVQQLFSMGSNAPVAYLAHLGGLGAGILLAPLLYKRSRSRRSKSTSSHPARNKRSCRPSNASGSPTC